MKNKNNVELPEMYRSVIALLVFDDIPPTPLTGFMAETSDTKEQYFHAYNKRGYHPDLIAKWDYLDEIYPGFCLSAIHQKQENISMNMEHYQIQAFTTCTESSKNIYYMALGLTGESGEIANKIKKVMRDGTPLNQQDIEKELGDVLWYVASLCTVLDISLDEVARINLKKLADRKQRGVIGGSGDNR